MNDGPAWRSIKDDRPEVGDTVELKGGVKVKLQLLDVPRPFGPRADVWVWDLGDETYFLLTPQDTWRPLQ